MEELVVQFGEHWLREQKKQKSIVGRAANMLLSWGAFSPEYVADQAGSALGGFGISPWVPARRDTSRCPSGAGIGPLSSPTAWPGQRLGDALVVPY